MTDAIAAAAATIDAAPSSTEPVQALEVAQAGESSVNTASEIAATAAACISSTPDASAISQPAEATTSKSSEQQGTRAASDPMTQEQADAFRASANNQFVHHRLLSSLVTTLRRKWNLFDGELEAILKEAESHL